MEIKGDILTPNGWIRGQISGAERIDSLEGDPIAAPKAPFILPGFVDLHVHGGQGHDMMQGAAAIEAASCFHATRGTTSLLATSVTAPIADIEQFLRGVKTSMGAKEGARVLGAHLEGPFISPDKLGAQPAFAIEARLDLVKDWLAIAPVKVMTIAPEMDADGAVTAYLQSQGVKVQIGHSLCSYAEAMQALHSGCGVTHLFNAMTRLAHRENGIAGAAMAFADYAEIIPDLHHVEEGAILAARRAIPNLYGVTDAMSGAGMPDGEFALGAHKAIKTGDVVRLASGSLAGSVLTMDQALRNLVSIGLPLEEASARLSRIPADWIGMRDIGRLEAGAFKDFLVLDNDLQILDVYVGGKRVQRN